MARISATARDPNILGIVINHNENLFDVLISLEALNINAVHFYSSLSGK